MSNITQVVNVDKNMTALKKGIHAADLDQVLSGTGPFTLFAPSDMAFNKLEAGTLENLLKPENKVKLIALLNGHVIAGKVNFKDLKEGDTLTTVSGTNLAININDGKVSVNGSTIQHHDVSSSNGVVHSLDTVLNN